MHALPHMQYAHDTGQLDKAHLGPINAIFTPAYLPYQVKGEYVSSRSRTWELGIFSPKKYLVWLCWKGCRPPSTHWRGPTTDPHGDSWLLALAPGPVRPSSSNLNPPDSSVGPMLMRALVRTPDQHDPMTNRVPSLKPSLTRASW